MDKSELVRVTQTSLTFQTQLVFLSDSQFHVSTYGELHVAYHNTGLLLEHY
jgi:hypothetical protein